MKAKPINVAQLEELYAHTKSYEALFNRRAKLYKEMDLKNQTLSEKDYRQFILDDYTFLKRPVFMVDNEIFVGNSKNVIEDLKKKIAFVYLQNIFPSLRTNTQASETLSKLLR